MANRFKVIVKSKQDKKSVHTYPGIVAADKTEAFAWGEKQAAQFGPLDEHIVEVWPAEIAV